MTGQVEVLMTIFEEVYGNKKVKTPKDGSPPSRYHGWRRLPSGKREEVWYDFIFGWMSREERNELRQTDPRIAP